jgi:hypothetical protein
VPIEVLQTQTSVFSGLSVTVGGGGVVTNLTPDIMFYLTAVQERQATYINSFTAQINFGSAVNPVTKLGATYHEFDIFINGQYIDKALYNWTPSVNAPQTIIFDTATIGYNLTLADTIIIKGRWAQ